MKKALLLLVVFGVSGLDASAASWDELYRDAANHYRSGAFDQAAALWRSVAEGAASSQPELSVRAALGLSAACLKAGLYQESEQSLSNAWPLAAKAGASLQAQFLQQSANVRLAMHRHAQALEAFSEALVKAKEAADGNLVARVLNDYGNALAVSGYISDAHAAYSQSLKAARELDAGELAVNVLLNLARLHLKRDDQTSAREALSEARASIAPQPPSYEWAMTLLGIADVERDLDRSSAPAQRRLADLERIAAYAAEAKNSRLSSIAFGYEGRERAARLEFERAVELSRRALFHAAQSRAPDLAYQWQWQLATLLRRQNKLVEAIDAYGKAITALAPIRQELLNGYHDSYAYFQRSIRPVYIEYVDALLADADSLPEGPAQRERLERARVVLETLKSAELQDYFRDECVVAQENKSLELSQVGANSAVLYPIVLSNRIELLVIINGEFHRRSVVVDQDLLQENALRFREFVQTPGNTRFLPYANRLYRWLIEPIRAPLTAAGVDTLVVIADGVLRTVPFAALHTGERYLIEELAIAVTPSLKLTSAPQPRPSEARALLAGVAQSVQGFAPLPQVEAELATIHDQVGGRLLSNRDYTKAKLREALSEDDFSIVHMATHGVVGASPADSYLLTYDGKLTMGDLDYLLRIGEFRERPVDLLTLSACETAVGDERAALGLAGMAVKSGVQSVVASLWLVDDAATAELMNRFYRNLNLRGGGNASKAKALRAAKMGMLGNPATEHPANWAAFMIIGNWQ